MPPDPNMPVLVVEDFATMRRIVKTMLRRIGFTNLVEAEDGRQALNAPRKGQYGFVVTDWNMPSMTGIELPRAIRGDPKLSATPVLMVTAEADKRNVLDAAKSGVTNYIVKPFTVETMQAKIEKIFPWVGQGLEDTQVFQVSWLRPQESPA
ncbi:MAG: response regulator [Candidatus Sumerlaeota bacterium]|nr:response regulator [Candidatus Sumerlaeota bacterium]